MSDLSLTLEDTTTSMNLADPRIGRISCAQLLEDCIRNIERWESKVRAWAHLDIEGARSHARELDKELSAGKNRGPLHGVPIGVKDIIDVAGMPTTCGSKLWSDRRPQHDARVVAQLRAAGAVILGKTVTTAYAWIDPPITRNPWNLERTPGGSSSGSAAAVASGMCVGAVGSQTGGSIIRPAAFCGVVGFKPSFVVCSHEAGVLPFAASLDHVGPIARTVEDARLLFNAMFGATGEWKSGPPSIALLKGSYWEKRDSALSRAMESTVTKLSAAGARIPSFTEPLDFDRVFRSHRTIMSAEAAANHLERLRLVPHDYPERIRSLIEEGARISAFDYLQAKQLQTNSHTLEGRGIRNEFEALYSLLKQVDCLAVPATLGPAPDPSSTGDPSYNSPWSFFGFPTLTLPIGMSPDGLPLAIQLVARDGADMELLSVGSWCEKVMGLASGKRGG